MSRALFIGRFVAEGAARNGYSSIAGTLVQQQIVRESKKLLNECFYVIAMEPRAAWPRGEFWVPGTRVAAGEFISYANLPIVRSIFLAIHVAVFCIKNKTKFILQYNSYFIENLVVLALRKVLGIRCCIIVQDYRTGAAFGRLHRIYDKLSAGAIRWFDFVVPVTKKLAKDLDLDESRYEVFPGGVTEPGYESLAELMPTEPYAVFAGALEPHNGIDRLLEAWCKLKEGIDLHIFGRGSLEGRVADYSRMYDSIFYHGLRPQEAVLEWQRRARFNICLRYSDGIYEEYFFPSKFFNVACCPGLLLTNRFMNMPEYMDRSLGLVDNNLDNLKYVLTLSDESIASEALSRREGVLAANSWGVLLKEIYRKFDLTGDAQV